MKDFYRKLQRFMDEFAEGLSNSLSSMTMFWIIALLVIVPLFFTQPVGLVGWMQYIVSVFFQGVALPVLGYTAKLGAKRTDDVIVKIEELSIKIDERTAHIEKDVDAIVEDVDDIRNELEES